MWIRKPNRLKARKVFDSIISRTSAHYHHSNIHICDDSVIYMCVCAARAHLHEFLIYIYIT